jgi:hypothetical protein
MDFGCLARSIFLKTLFQVLPMGITVASPTYQQDTNLHMLESLHTFVRDLAIILGAVHSLENNFFLVLN